MTNVVDKDVKDALSMAGAFLSDEEYGVVSEALRGDLSLASKAIRLLNRALPRMPDTLSSPKSMKIFGGQIKFLIKHLEATKVKRKGNK